MKRLLLATHNEGKLRELREMLGGLPLELETLAAHPDAGEVEETGDSFEANARLKAEGYAKRAACWTVAEDSGLVVDALGGEPGVHSARFSGEHGDDAANNEKLRAAMQGKTDRSARYICALALARPDGTVVSVAQGVCEGEIVDAPRGQGGFGYDPFFVAVGETRTNAELDPAAKNALSHRGQALRSFLPLLRIHLLSNPAD